MASKKKWIGVILGEMQKLGIEPEKFGPFIEDSADIFYLRDMARDQLKKSGYELTMNHTNKFGATNLSKSPQYLAWKELDDKAMERWRELGLTPSSYKKLSGDGPKKEAAGGLAAALKSLDC